ncbi:MAG: hypothetical protein PHX93_00935 [Candidatus Peribacteraceae bacterium]|jgi:A/G-specific adenine glycosylase|nr:hypothetical protein [Candidatus Peribacteraceae bacterium]
MRKNERIQSFVEEIWHWYAVHKRPLPWRDIPVTDDTERAYRILVSEVMLQQTQVERVAVLYCRFLQRFPTLGSLAAASNRDVILAWRGMGYNARALRLRDAARRIVDSFLVSRFSLRGGKRKTNNEQTKNGFPRSMEELTAIPGIGHYTAAAIRNFAFNIPTPCIDTNIRRILHRTFVGPENADGTWEKDDKYVLRIAAEVLDAAVTSRVARDSLARFSMRSQTSNPQPANGQPPRDAANWHAALMDFGSIVQTKRNPQWDICPLTARGLMKATIINFPRSEVRIPKSEPGRHIAGRFIPNRIVRGRIVEALREAPSGLLPDALGKRIAADWSPAAHRSWLAAILAKLRKEALVEEQAGVYVLRSEP